MALPDPKALGASFGLDFGETDLLYLTAEDMAGLKCAVFERGLLLFRRQVLSNQDLQYVAGCFGEIDDTAKGGRPSWAETATIYISNLRTRNGSKLGSLGTGDLDWHADNYHLDRPSLSFLYALEPAPHGGRTLFQCMKARYRKLPDAMKRRVAGLHALYRQPEVAGQEGRMFARPIVFESADGVRYLDISERAVGIQGVSPEEERELMSRLLGDLESEEHIYAHDWAVGDLIIYDNVQLLHRREAFDGLRLYKAARAFVEHRLRPAGTE